MKASKSVWLLVATGLAALALNFGCADKGPPPPPPGVAVVGFAPDYCFWDGYEYVGWYGDGYYYWGPGQVWIICDPVRVQRVNVWVTAHPDWRARATPMVQRPAEVERPPRPLRPAPGRHDNDLDR
jgi:hypothetical protein